MSIVFLNILHFFVFIFHCLKMCTFLDNSTGGGYIQSEPGVVSGLNIPKIKKG
jgi:hypothetical protein